MFSVYPFPCDDWENIYTLSYYHHQIGSMNYYPLFRVRSWNNGMRCMFLYILTTILPLAHSGCRILSCPAPSFHLSVHLSIHSALVTTPQPTIFHGSYSYLAQLLTLIWLKIYEYTDWLASWCRPAKGFPLPRPLYFIVYISFHFRLLN